MDGKDRSKIREEFSECHHPLKSEAVKVINISNGCVADDKVNVHNAVSIGKRIAAEFQNGLSDSFHQSVHVQVYTMESMKKGIKIGEKVV